MKILPMILICCFVGFLFVNCTAQAFVFETGKKFEYDIDKGLKAGAEGVFDTKATVDDTTPAKVIGQLLTYLLTMLELVFLVIVIVSGIVWMSAGGDSAKTEKALKWLINGVIGLVIATAAYAIVYFVTRTVIEAGGGVV